MNTLKVLILDQNNFLKSELSTVLLDTIKPLDAEMTHCRSYWEAFRHLFAEKWDMVLVNETLNGKSCSDTAEYIKALLVNTPVIIFTHEGKLAHKVIKEKMMTQFDDLFFPVTTAHEESTGT